MPYKITFQPGSVEITAEPGETVMQAAARVNLHINNLCGGQGVCGKCRVKLLKGHPEFDSKYLRFLTKAELDAGYVLACRSKVKDSDLEIWIPPESRQEEAQILTTDNIFKYEAPIGLEEGGDLHPTHLYRPLCRKYYMALPEPTLQDNLSDLERIYRHLRGKIDDRHIEARFSCLPGLASLLRENDWKATATMYLKDADAAFLLGMEGGDTTHRNYGVAVDVGTTTIAAQLINLQDGKSIGAEGSHNLQARYGEDVISRMVYACGAQKGLGPLQDAVASTINTLVDSLTKVAGINHEDVTCYSVAGNTTMTHLLLGLQPCHIRLEPYIPTASRVPPVRAHDLHLVGHPQAILHCLPCVSSYIGGDITAGVLACGINDQPEVQALIDIGTNGEIAIGNNEWLVCCSASAGPAFEGGGIKCGMRATKGAIQKVVLSGEDVKIQTVGKSKPAGICGSALIDVIAELAAERIIDQSGKFVNFDHPHVRTTDGVPEFVLAEGARSATGEPVVITQDDIGNLIKSKGAILAAMKVLVNSIGMTFTDLDKIFVAGGFGAYLDIERAITIGLLPDVPLEKIQFAGNTSLAGARQSLLSSHSFKKCESIAKQMTYFELSVNPQYMDEFVASLFLPHTDMTLFPTVAKHFEERGK